MENLMKERRKKRIAAIMAVSAFIVGIILIVINYYTSRNDNVSETEIVVQDDSYKDNYLSTIMGEVYAEPGEIIKEKSFQVFQVYTPHAALVSGKSEGGGYYGITYLLVRDKYYYLLNNHDSEFYDEQIVKVPKGKVVRMFGTYSYTTRDGRYKTVPRIMIVDK